MNRNISCVTKIGAGFLIVTSPGKCSALQQNRKNKLLNFLRRASGVPVEGQISTDQIKRCAVSSFIHSRLRSVLSAFVFIIATSLAPSAFAGMQYIKLCNQGSINIAVAWADETRAILGMGQLWKSEGWFWVKPNNCSNIWVSSLEENTVLNLVFAVQTPEGTFGVIEYPLNVRDIPNRQKSICVRGDEYTLNSSPVPPCSPPYVAVPTSSALWISGSVDWKLIVKPSTEDFKRLAVVLRGPDVSTQLTLPPKPAPTHESSHSPSFLERLVMAYNKSEEERARLLNSCAKAGNAWQAEDLERHCTCVVNAVLASGDSYMINTLSKEWDQTIENLYLNRWFDLHRKCPQIPKAKSQASTIAENLASENGSETSSTKLPTSKIAPAGPLPGSGPEIPLRRSLRIINECKHSARVAVTYKNLNGSWYSVGWWKIPGESFSYLIFKNGTYAITESPIFFFYAENPANSLYWRGDLNFKIDEEEVLMQKVELHNQYAEYLEASLVC